jgi:hypothetical protein
MTGCGECGQGRFAEGLASCINSRMGPSEEQQQQPDQQLLADEARRIADAAAAAAGPPQVFQFSRTVSRRLFVAAFREA